MSRPRLLDLFCGGGGCSRGYHDAGFDVVGVDLNPMPEYPYEFHQGDALEYLREHGHKFDAIHASPPCQAYSWSARRWNVERADLVGPTRELLIAIGRPYVIENVVGAPLHNPVVLTGTMFGLGVVRRRLFETNWFLLAPSYVSPVGSVREGQYVTVAGHGGDGRAALHLWKAAMGIDWMTRKQLTQAIPPAYTHYIGTQLCRHLEIPR